MKVSEAMKVLEKAINEDEGYAYSWHANIAMMCHDAFKSADIIDGYCEGELLPTSNDAASRFMKLCFNAETSQDMLLK